MSSETISLVTIPLFSGAIGYVTNWTGVWMLFNPVRFAGFRMPGLRAISQILPRRIQQIPGIMVGGIGWQGIIPSRAAKMGSIMVDRGIAKLGKPGEFYDRIDPETLADYIVEERSLPRQSIVTRCACLARWSAACPAELPAPTMYTSWSRNAAASHCEAP